MLHIALLCLAAGAGLSWLWPLVDGAPPIGWEAAGAYLTLPVLVVVSRVLDITGGLLC